MKLLDIDIEIGEARQVGALFVFPLIGPARAEPPITSAAGPLAAGLLEIGELETPTVPCLEADNLGETAILLVEGEILVGAAQDRTLNVTVLCPPRAKTEIPVSCVEAGRWGGRGGRVQAATAHTSSRLRAAKLEAMQRDDRNRTARRSDQGEVWRRVDDYAVTFGVASGTAALEDVNRSKASDVAGQLGDLALADGQVGLAVAGAGAVLGVDLFDRPSILEEHLKEILSGYALDIDDAIVPTTLAAVEAFLEAVARADHVVQPGVGLGEEIHLRSEEVTGVGLAYEGRIVHLAAFPMAADAE